MVTKYEQRIVVSTMTPYCNWPPFPVHLPFNHLLRFNHRAFILQIKTIYEW
ncbi:hypothetical protein QJS04_geneDACA012895 [Acorus gramineus]|uniref:Uncharacterized protein n=1 Tax=Acorus gramineus TaxID=55184 RepID=A0AAV9BF14_ACOGR|nr:hypothetical protein QJS04_geneDACA012895 [Acorus gramineus]